MKSTYKSVISILLALLLLGAMFALIDARIDDDKEDEIEEDEGTGLLPDGGDVGGDLGGGDEVIPTPNVIGGTWGFITDFSDVTVVQRNSDEYRFEHKYLYNLPTQLFVEEGMGTISVKDEALVYECTESGANVTYPKFKLKPLNYSARLYLSMFKVLTVDFDIEYEIDFDSQYASGFCALFNTRSQSTESTVCKNDDYYRFDNSGKGHYTFVYYDTGAVSDIKIFIYKDGVLVETVERFIYDTEYDANDLYVSCLNLELTRNAGDKVKVDNLEFHYFEDGYTGAIMDLIENPDVNLSTCKDSVLYGG